MKLEDLKKVGRTFCPDGLPILPEWRQLLEMLVDNEQGRATPKKR